jgi:hypothetical protein
MSIKFAFALASVFISPLTQAQDSTRKVQTAEIRIEIAKPLVKSGYGEYLMQLVK